MLIWQKGSKGAIRVRMNGSPAYVFVKVEKLQSIVGETFEEVKATRKDCHELSIAYGWLAGAKFILPRGGARRGRGPSAGKSGQRLLRMDGGDHPRLDPYYGVLYICHPQHYSFRAVDGTHADGSI